MGPDVTQQGLHLRRSADSVAQRSAYNDFLHVRIMAVGQVSGRRPALGVAPTESASGAAQELGNDLAGLLTTLVGDAL